MNESLHPRHPLVDPAVLARLSDELQPGSGICEVFVNDYIALLPLRLDRLHRAVESLDLKAAMDAVLSLKTSSLMVGACRLATLAGVLESELRDACARPAPAASAVRNVLETIDACTAATVAGLSTRTAA